MKKTLVALAALAAATGAFAQTPNARAIDASGVTIFGVADATISRFSANNNGGSLLQMSGDGRNESTRLGFRGVEDMGGGLGASFWLEAAYDQDRGTGSNTTNNNTAAGDKMSFTYTTADKVITPATQSLIGRQGLTFNRAATVSLLGKGFGEVRVGRDYAASFWNYTVNDPFGTVGVGSALHVIGGSLTPFGAQNAPPGNAYPLVRTSNALSWLSNNMSGFRLQLQYALAEQPSVCTQPLNAVNANYCYGGNNDGNLVSGRLNFNNGPLDVSYSYQKTTYGNVDKAAAPTLAVTFAGFTDTTVRTVAGTAVTATAAAPFANATAYLGDLTINNLGGTYTLGATKLYGQWGTIARNANLATVEQKLTHTLIGVAHNMGALTLKASYNTGKRTDGSANSAGTAGNTAGNSYSYNDGAKMTQLAVGAVYDFSKRTAVYGTYSTNTITAPAVGTNTLVASQGYNGPAIAAGGTGTVTGLDIGIRHRF